MNVHVVTWLDVEVSRCCNKTFWYYRYLGILSASSMLYRSTMLVYCRTASWRVGMSMNGIGLWM